MTAKQIITTMLLSILLLGLSSQAEAQEDTSSASKRFYVKPYVGFIGIQDMDITIDDGATKTPVAVKSGFGYTTGLSVGYAFTNNFSAELGWEYKSNNVEATFANTTYDGNYASNFIYLNGRYTFNTSSKFAPYIGAGITYIEEIDFDFEIGNTENSFAENGDIGFNILAGLDYNFSDRWTLNWELRSTFFSDIELSSEENSNVKLTDLKYNPFVINIGIKYRF